MFSLACPSGFASSPALFLWFPKMYQTPSWLWPTYTRLPFSWRLFSSIFTGWLLYILQVWSYTSLPEFPPLLLHPPHFYSFISPTRIHPSIHLSLHPLIHPSIHPSLSSSFHPSPGLPTKVQVTQGSTRRSPQSPFFSFFLFLFC